MYPPIDNMDLGPETLLRRLTPGPVECHWCTKLLPLLDGRRSLGEVCEHLHLPINVGVKLAQRALNRGWAQVVQASPDFLDALRDHLHGALGDSGEHLLEQATRMTRLHQDQLTPDDYGHLLIALELAADDRQRGLIQPHLDQLRQRHVAPTVPPGPARPTQDVA